MLADKRSEVEKIQLDRQVEIAALRSQQEDAVTQIMDQHRQAVKKLQDQCHMEVCVPALLGLSNSVKLQFELSCFELRFRRTIPRLVISRVKNVASISIWYCSYLP